MMAGPFLGEKIAVIVTVFMEFSDLEKNRVVSSSDLVCAYRSVNNITPLSPSISYPIFEIT